MDNELTDRLRGPIANTTAQILSELPDRFAVRQADVVPNLRPGDWWSVVSTPSGLTVIGPAGPNDTEVWRGVHAAEGHALDIAGMLAALVRPLAAARVPVFVASTWTADMVLVPDARWVDALVALRAAGHTVHELL